MGVDHPFGDHDQFDPDAFIEQEPPVPMEAFLMVEKDRDELLVLVQNLAAQDPVAHATDERRYCRFCNRWWAGGDEQPHFPKCSWLLAQPWKKVPQ